MRPRFLSAATTAPVVTVRLRAYSVYAVASRTTPSTNERSTDRTSSYSRPLMRFTPARRASRRTEPLVMPRLLPASTFLRRLPDVPLDSPDFLPLAIVMWRSARSTTTHRFGQTHRDHTL